MNEGSEQIVDQKIAEKGAYGDYDLSVAKERK
jgi:hypothetical protein